MGVAGPYRLVHDAAPENVVWTSYTLSPISGHKTRCASLNKTFSMTVQLFSSIVSSASNTHNLKGYDTAFSMNMWAPVLLLFVSV